MRKLGQGEVLVAIIMCVLVASRLLITKKRAVQCYSHALLILSSLLLSGFVVNIAKVVIGRPRPKLFFETGLYHPQWFELSHTLRSFPSGHASSEATLIFGLWLLAPKAWPVWLTLLIAWLPTSVMIQAHWISDVCMGTYIACLILWLLYPYRRNITLATIPCSQREDIAALLQDTTPSKG